TQQNAALVEQLTSASQAMKTQAQELLRKVEEFKIGAINEGSGAKPERPRNLGPVHPGRAGSLQAVRQSTVKQKIGSVRGRRSAVPSWEKRTDGFCDEAVQAMSGQEPSGGLAIGEGRIPKGAGGEFEEF
ncbi:MAG: hypothetical protein NNA31_12825, partial [Nitrospira sp.]|nr:hypothetical protein [Nitrospira sp.]